ncbi:MAG: hypothetical protein FGM39_03230 [Phycisphaerales bacterium]|nr:hypothetical protein [Phycisphaerales bacterium]
MRNPTITPRLSIAALLAAGLCQATALGQDALGGNVLQRDTRHGDPSKISRYGVLDASTRQGSAGDNGQAAKVDYFSRNLIVTGDVGGGRQFRGSVGYREQSEFTGQTGADDLRFFTAYSVYSSPYMAQANYNPMQASQNFGAIMYTRTYANASARDILTDQQPLDARIAFDRFSADGAKTMRRQADFIDPGNTRDVSERLNWRITQQISAGSRTERNEIALDDSLASLGLSPYDRQRLKQDILSGRTQRELVVGEPLSQSSLLPGQSLSDSARMKPILAPEYSQIMDSLRARAADRMPRGRDGAAGAAGAAEAGAPGAAGAEATTPQSARDQNIQRLLGVDMDWLRGQLVRSGIEGGADGTGRIPGAMGPRSEPGTAPEGAAPGGQGGAADTTGADGQPKDGEAKPAEKDTPNIDDLAYVLRHGRSLQSLVPEESSAIKDMMELGAAAMAKGEYFRAEERYSSVLQVVPGSAFALAGVANAQLGAGLHVSAALSLRKLFAMHPEMIDTHLSASILPASARMDAALAAARERLAGANAPTASPELKSDRFEFGLVIAYIGFQSNRPDVIKEGLDSMGAARPGDALHELLSRVWLPADTAPAQPAP